MVLTPILPLIILADVHRLLGVQFGPVALRCTETKTKRVHTQRQAWINTRRIQVHGRCVSSTQWAVLSDLMREEVNMVLSECAHHIYNHMSTNAPSCGTPRRVGLRSKSGHCVVGPWAWLCGLGRRSSCWLVVCKTRSHRISRGVRLAGPGKVCP